MLTLRPFAPSDSAAVVSWLPNEHAFRQWSADRYPAFPISAADMNAYYAQNPCRVYSVWLGERLVGHFILRHPDGKEDQLRLGFVILNPALRGKGLGREMVRLAAGEAFADAKVQRLTLGVFENNPAALHCYLSAGFCPVNGAERESYFCMGEAWPCLEMSMSRSEFLNAKA